MYDVFMFLNIAMYFYVNRSFLTTECLQTQKYHETWKCT